MNIQDEIIQDADPDKYKIVVSGSTPIILDISMPCDFCGQHPWTSDCPRAICVCGSTVTITVIDKLDSKRVRRCLRCNAVAIWEKPSVEGSEP